MSNERYIVVLMGGISPEREISMQSGKAVADALSKDNNVIKIIVNDDMVNELDNYKIDVAFIALHGYFGEDGGIQGVLESKGIPYTGSGITASKLAMNKVESKDIFRKNNVPTPDYFTTSAIQNVSEITNSAKSLKLPLITKPVSNGSSYGISIVKEYAGIKNAIEHTGGYGREILIEECIEGRELTVSVLNEKALPVIEIKTAPGFMTTRQSIKVIKPDIMSLHLVMIRQRLHYLMMFMKEHRNWQFVRTTALVAVPSQE